MIDVVKPGAIKKVIKVIGVGGGGGNAVNHMYNENIHNVSFAVCNADIQDLENSPIATRIQLGKDLTEGLGCGAKPEIGRQAAIESTEEIKELLSDGTKMVFITAGMGGGTGTGAAPMVAKIAKDMGLLTIGIVTIPFEFELGSRIKKAIQGVVDMKQYVDALLVINNEKLITLYPEMTLDAAFYKADEVLSESAKGIAEMITKHGEIINVDYADVRTILMDSGVAIMNTGMGMGENRVKDAIEEALHTPLLKSKDITKATRLLMYVYTSKEHKLTMVEMKQISSFVKTINKDQEELMIWGGTYDDNLEASLKITIIATGFDFTDMDDYDSLYSEYYENKPTTKEQSSKQEDVIETTPEERPNQTEEHVTEPEQPVVEQNEEVLEVINYGDWTSDIDEDEDLNTPPSLRKK